MSTFVQRLFATCACLAALSTLAEDASAQPHAAHAAKVEPAPSAAAVTPGKSGERDADAKDPDAAVEHGAQKLTLDIDVENITKFEVGPATFNVEFVVSTTCEHAPCKPEYDLGNGRITAKEKFVDEPLTKVTKYKAEVTGVVDLSEFPFDKHVLSLELQEKSDPLDTSFALSSGEMKIDPRVKLSGWAINPKPEAKILRQDLDATHHYDTVLYGVEIERPRTAALFKSLVPAFFMVFVMMLTLLLKPKSAAARLSAATGALMTLVMFHLSSTSALPPLGYLTRLDKFMLANYFVYFINIIFAVVILRMDERKNERGAELAYLSALGAVPGLALLAWMIVFLKLV